MPESPKQKAEPRAAKSNNAIVQLIDGEHTVRETAVDTVSMLNPWNPDDLYRKRYDYSIYEEMMKDDQVSVAMAVKKDLIVGSGWEIQAEEEDQEDIKYELEVCLEEDCEGSFEDALTEIISAYEMGFSVTEKQFQLKEEGKLSLKALKTRHPISWLFHQDKYGNVIRYEQQGTTDEFRDIDPSSIIHFINNPRFGNPYGTSDLRPAYAPYFIKNQIIRFYAIFLEKAASPTAVGKYSPHSEKTHIEKLHNVLKKLQTSTAIVIPKDLEVEWLEVKAATAGEAYVKGINLFNMLIGRAMLLPDLLGYQGGETGGGSYALGEKQLMVFFKHIHRRRRTIENIVNEHIVKPIIMWNYGEMDKYPKFKLKPIDEAVAVANAKLWLELVKGPNHKPTLAEINQFKRIVDFPETTEEEWQEQQDEIEKAAQLAAGASVVNGNDKGEPKGKKKDAKKDNEKSKKKTYAIADSAEGSFHKKTDFARIERELDYGLDSIMKLAEPLVDQAYFHFGEKITGLDLSSASKLKKLNQLGLRDEDRAALNQLLNASFKSMYETAKVIALGEVSGLESYAKQVEPEFLKTIEAEDFNFVGDWEYQISKRAKAEIIAAIKDGRPISSVVDILRADGKKDSLVSLERYARTKFTEVMNNGRVAYFESTGVVAAYQYSAVLDGRTTALCRGLHGKIFLKENLPPIPGHWSCRSILIPITKFEDFQVDGKVGDEEIGAFIEANKGKGF